MDALLRMWRWAGFYGERRDAAEGASRPRRIATGDVERHRIGGVPYRNKQPGGL